MCLACARPSRPKCRILEENQHRERNLLHLPRNIPSFKPCGASWARNRCNCLSLPAANNPIVLPAPACTLQICLHDCHVHFFLHVIRIFVRIPVITCVRHFFSIHLNTTHALYADDPSGTTLFQLYAHRCGLRTWSVAAPDGSAPDRVCAARQHVVAVGTPVVCKADSV